MRTVKHLESKVVRAKAAWRKALLDPAVSMEDRRKARSVWRDAIAAKDRTRMLLLMANSNRRDVGNDRRKGGGPDAPEADRRKGARIRRG